MFGVDGVPVESITHEYDAQGHVVRDESRHPDGTWNYTQTNVYDEAGHVVESRNFNRYSEYVYTYEYDEKGRQVKSTNANKEATYSITEVRYNDNDQPCYRKETYPQMNRVSETYTTFNAEGEENGNRCYVTDQDGYRLYSSDSVFVDKKGFMHQRQFNCYENTPKTMEGVFNKEGFLTHYEYFEGNSENPSVVADFNFEKDGVTLRDVVWKELSLGQVKNTRTYACMPRYDTFGNWIRRTRGVSYLFDGGYTGYDDLHGLLTNAKRTITYRGNDQGQNYGFEGKAGKADLHLNFTEDDEVFFGNLSIDGNDWRAVGKRNADGSMFFVALMEEGDIPWSLSIPAGEGRRNATLFDCAGDEEIPVTLNPTRKDLPTYQFSTTPDDLVGLYRYNFEGLHTSGEIDTYREGEDWEDLHYSVENVWYGSVPKIATDEQTVYIGDQTEFYIYKWSEDVEGSLEYTIRFFDRFAVIRIVSGDPSLYFPFGTTIEGIYAKLPAVG